MKQLSLNFEQMVSKIEEVPAGEEIKMDFFNVKAFNTETIKTCQGDLFIICNVLADYCDILERKLEEDERVGLSKASFEYYIDRCRGIYKKLATQLNYDRDKALEKCLKERAKNRNKDEVGEDALVLAARGKKGL